MNPWPQVTPGRWRRMSITRQQQNDNWNIFNKFQLKSHRSKIFYLLSKRNPAALSINKSVVVSVGHGNEMQTNEFTCQNKWVIVFLSCISNYNIYNYMIYPECIMGPHNQVKYCFALTY